MCQADFRQVDGAVFLIDFVFFGLQLFDDLPHLAVPFEVALCRAGDDERRACFINQHVVYFIHDGVIMSALDALIEAHGHVVAQVIETELGVRSVGNICRVRFDTIHQPQMVLVFVRRFFFKVEQERFLSVFGGGSHLQNAGG